MAWAASRRAPWPIAAVVRPGNDVAVSSAAARSARHPRDGAPPHQRQNHGPSRERVKFDGDRGIVLRGGVLAFDIPELVKRQVLRRRDAAREGREERQAEHVTGPCRAMRLTSSR